VPAGRMLVIVFALFRKVRLCGDRNLLDIMMIVCHHHAIGHGLSGGEHDPTAIYYRSLKPPRSDLLASNFVGTPLIHMFVRPIARQSCTAR
jgi:hypothetical protein